MSGYGRNVCTELAKGDLGQKCNTRRKFADTHTIPEIITRTHVPHS